MAKEVEMCRHCGKFPKREGFHLCAKCVDEMFPPRPVPASIKQVLKKINKGK